MKWNVNQIEININENLWTKVEKWTRRRMIKLELKIKRKQDLWKDRMNWKERNKLKDYKEKTKNLKIEKTNKFIKIIKESYKENFKFKRFIRLQNFTITRLQTKI